MTTDNEVVTKAQEYLKDIQYWQQVKTELEKLKIK